MEKSNVNMGCEFTFEIVRKDTLEGTKYAIQVSQIYPGAAFTWLVPVDSVDEFMSGFNDAVHECFQQYLDHAHEHDGKLKGCYGCTVIAASKLN